MKSYDHKRILITGASGGIGAAMARQLAAPGRLLLLTARSQDQLEQVAKDVEAAGGEAMVLPLDFSIPGTAAELHQAATAGNEPVDVLINNAGFGRRGRFDDIDAATYESMVTLNVTNLVSLTRLCLPDMLRRGDAGILNIASTAAYQPVPFMSVYAATKSFVLSFSEALAAELKDEDVTVTCLSPGATDTNFADRAGTSHLAFVNFSETAEKVATVGLEALLKGRRSKVSGVANGALAHLVGILPRGPVIGVARRLFVAESPDGGV